MPGGTCESAQTAEGKNNHQSAQAQYETLAFSAITNRALYYPVDAGRVNVFGETIEALGQSLVSQIKQASMGEVVPGSALTASNATPASPAPAAPPAAASPSAAIAQDAVLIGRAMQLAYLGGATNAKAPPFFQAWISDRDLLKQNGCTETNGPSVRRLGKFAPRYARPTTRRHRLERLPVQFPPKTKPSTLQRQFPCPRP